jgi:hypothetical protein
MTVGPHAASRDQPSRLGLKTALLRTLNIRHCIPLPHHLHDLHSMPM